jgi:hypothetical protein
MSEARAHRAWTPANIAAAVFFSGYLGIQLLLPVWRLTAAERPVRYGWQMYSTFVPPTVFLRESTAGVLDTVQVADHVARQRGDFDVRRYLPRHICSVDPTAAAVVVMRSGLEVPERYSCR